MSGFQSNNTEHLTRSNLWSSQLKEILREDLLAQKYVKMLDFPDGDTLNIPSIGQAEVSDYTEGAPVKYTAMDTGNFTFSITEYKQTGTYITEKAKQDLFYSSQLVAAFVPEQMHALSVAMETDVLRVGPEAQTATSLNAINGGNHRFIGGGTSETIDVADFSRAKYALQKANVPLSNLTAIVDPSVAFKLETQTNIVNLSSPNPKWGNIVNTGGTTGMRFVTNVYGFDVWTSDFLKKNIAETINGKSTTVGVANLFFSAAPNVLPFVGAVRQAPKVDSEFNKDFQREEYVVTCRYGYKLYRPENLVTIITDTDQVS